MKLFIFLTVLCVASSHLHENLPRRVRRKRDTLEILTNNAQPIHAEVKSEIIVTEAPEKAFSSPPEGDQHIITSTAQAIHGEVRPEPSVPEVTEKVLPPKDVINQAKSFRKSWPLTNRLDLIRSVTRVVTLTVLVISAVIEFYPLIKHLYYLM